MKPPRVHQLSPALVGKIAAGEVVERPASVVKELLENALDAGASRVIIELEQGGRELIRVVDDGCGIVAEDLPLVFARHATSKITTEEDLYRIGTLGFRGEALSAIGSVAWVRIQSRPASEEVGAQLICEGGQLGPIEPWAGPAGTCVEVRRLFFNTPARRKFLRSVATELGQIVETVQRLALAFPGVQFRLIHNEREVLEVPGSWERRERLRHFFGDDLAEHLLPVEYAQHQMRLHGWIGHPSWDRARGRWQYFFVNQRYVRDRVLAHAVQEAYRGYLMVGRQPVVFLFLEMPPETVDVNVHPMKIEVRFRDQSRIHQLVFYGVRQTLQRFEQVPTMTPTGYGPALPSATLSPEPAGSRTIGHRLANPTSKHTFDAQARNEAVARAGLQDSGGIVPGGVSGSTSAETGPIRVHTRGESGQEVLAESPAAESPATRDAVDSATKVSPVVEPGFFGMAPYVRAMQLHNTYLLVETPDGLLLIDQHALHERILYEHFRKQFQVETPPRQTLLVPEPVDLTPAQAALLLEQSAMLEQVGISISEFGGSTVLVRAVPSCWRRSAAELVQIAVEYLEEVARVPEPHVLLDELLKRMACRAAIKAGEPLSPEDIAFLLQHRSLVENAHHCPHGRPTALFLSKQELERQFRRSG
ncbi:MAG: DNA mismatch repair endonuclease MutL [Gemmatales bacterium]|nr:DNA mismatch repair endonuclease MutL [Gemmatales bacterium]MDW7994068.1 DNA mismatch repair endonuclease MutL [Gemmatales bacterium]